MSRTLKRPMFRMGGSTGTGITSGLDQPRKQYAQGTNPYAMGNFAPGTGAGFLTSFGLDNTISTIRTRYDGESQARLRRAKRRIWDRPLVTFGNLKVEGEYAPGINKNTPWFRERKVFGL